MRVADKEFLAGLDEWSENRKKKIRETPDCIDLSKGEVYYVASDGDDTKDGKTPSTAWKTLEKVSKAALKYGDKVAFKRGDLFRGFVKTKAGVTYCAYGVGEKPKFYGWEKNLADKTLWERVDSEGKIWKYTEKIPDCGTLVFNDGQKHSRKLIPSYIGGRFVCREAQTKPFEFEKEATQDLDIFCRYDERLTTVPSKGEDFPVPLVDNESYGELYLRCDNGNPGEVFSSIEAIPRRFAFEVGENEGVTIDNLCVKYYAFGVSAMGHVKKLKVQNCEFGWIGGNIQHYLGTDPNYPQGGRGTVTRFGNAVEVYGGCEEYWVENCYIYQVYDAGITHQVTTNGEKYEMKKIRYLNNLIEYCVYAIEYFLEKTDGDCESLMDDVLMQGNFLRFSGYGWGQQRHNQDTPAHIKGWEYENTASRFTISDNVFDRSAYRSLHLVAKKEESCPILARNTYIQRVGGNLGSYGANEFAKVKNLTFDDGSYRKIKEIFKDKSAKVYGVFDETLD